MDAMKDIAKEQKERMTGKRHLTSEAVQGTSPKYMLLGSERNYEKVPAGKNSAGKENMYCIIQKH